MTLRITTNEWHEAKSTKPWTGREVLCLFSDGHKEVCVWNGWYWRNQYGHRIIETVVQYITHFYIYEKHNQNELL